MANPNVDLYLHYDNRKSDMVAEGIDVALRIGKLRDSSLLCKHLWDMPRTLVANPDFEKKHGPLIRPEDLRNVPWIKFTGMENKRTFFAADGAKSIIEQSGNLSVNSIEAMLDLTINGAGLSSPPRHFVDQKLSARELVALLPNYQMTDLPVYAIWHRTTVPNLLAKRFIDAISNTPMRAPSR